MNKTCESSIIQFINLARQYPTYFIEVIERQIENFITEKEIALTPDIIYQTQQGKRLWVQTRDFLIKQKKALPLKYHQGLAKASSLHLEDMINNNMISHHGSDNSTFLDRISKYCKNTSGPITQLISTDFIIGRQNHAEMIVAGLIVDDGIQERGHRLAIFNPCYQYIGCKIGYLDEKIVCVINLSQHNLELHQNPEIELKKINLKSNFCQRVQSSSIVYNQTFTTDQPFWIHAKDTIIATPKSAKSNYTNIFPAFMNNVYKETNSYLLNHNFNQNHSKQKHNYSLTTAFKKQQKLKSHVQNQNKDTNKEKDKNANTFTNIHTNINKKLVEKVQNSRIYFEKDHKIDERTIKLIFSDGSTDQTLSKHTYYL